METDPHDEQDPLQDVTDIESMTVNRGFVPESLIFWRRRHRRRNPATAS